MNTNRNNTGRRLYGLLIVFQSLCFSCFFFIGCDGQTEGDLQLVNGSTPTDGRVEIFHDGRWGTICDDFWDDNDATVVCRQLNLSNFGEAIHKKKFPKGTGTIMLDDVDCVGNEDFLVNCSSRPWEEHDCRHTEDAGVRCRDILFCKSEPCLNGGTCQERAKGFTCFCSENFHGYLCERLSESRSNATISQVDGAQITELNILDEMETTIISRLYSLLRPYIVDIVLSVTLLCTMLLMLCLMCGIRRKLARIRAWERTNSFTSEEQIALTLGGRQAEHHMNEYNLQQHQEDEEETASDYEMPKDDGKDTGEPFNNLYMNTRR